MRRSFLLALCFGLSTLASAPWAYANGIFQSVRGDVRAAAGRDAPASVAKDQRVVPGTTVTTGAGAQTIIRFDDGHTVVLNENSEFRVNQYSFDKDKPQGDNIALQFLKGAMRSVSGLIGSRSRNAFALVAPQATFGIRGTDFMVAIVNPLYLQVIAGEITASNVAGTLSLAAGGVGTVASSTVIGTTMAAGALPGAVASSFSSLSSVAVTAGAGAGAGAGGGTGAGAGAGAGAGVGAGVATGAGLGGVTLGTIGIIGGVVAGVAAVVGNTQSNTSGTTGTTGAR